MLMTRWNRLAELDAMEREAERIFGNLFGVSSRTKGSEPVFFRLPVNIEEVDGAYRITAPLAGFKPEEVDVTFANGALTISAKHSEEKKSESNGYVRREVLSGNLYRQIPVGDVDPKTISAQFENGVLSVTVPAPAKALPAKIEIGTGSAENKQVDSKTN
jgi:HSP20 family protein